MSDPDVSRTVDDVPPREDQTLESSIAWIMAFA